MKLGALTVGTAAVQVPVTAIDGIVNGLRLLARAANTGNVYVGTSPDLTTATGNLVPKGAPATTPPYTVPAHHFGTFDRVEASADQGRHVVTHSMPVPGREVWLIADTAGQVVDWSAD